MLDDLLLRSFDIRSYNCWNLAREVWLRLTGQVLDAITLTDTSSTTLRGIVEDVSVRYRQIPSPTSPCLVLLMKPRHAPHIGVYYDGKVMHIQRAGVQYVPLETAQLGFTSVRFYVPCTQ